MFSHPSNSILTASIIKNTNGNINIIEGIKNIDNSILDVIINAFIFFNFNKQR